MALDKQTVHDIARLARLRVDDDETEKYQTALSNILNLVEQMEACDTSDVIPMTHPFDATLRLRPDEITEPNARDKYQAIAPDIEDGLYLVPKVID